MISFTYAVLKKFRLNDLVCCDNF